jgi:hypothetical protein
MSLQSTSSAVSDSFLLFQMDNDSAVSSRHPSEGGKGHTKGSSPTSVSQSIGDNNNSSSNSTLLKNQYTTEIVKSLFGSLVGNIHYHCTCHHPSRHMSGKLYIGTNALAFYSNLFGIERKLLLEYTNISAVNEYRTTSIAVCYKEQEYKFRALPQRTDLLTILKQLIHNSTGRDCVTLVVAADSTQDMPIDSKRNKIDGSRKFRTKLMSAKIPQDDQFPSQRRGRINSADVYPSSSSGIKKEPFINHRQRSLSAGTLTALVGSNSSTQEHTASIYRVDSSDSNLGDNLTGEVLGFLGYSSLNDSLDDEANYDGKLMLSTEDLQQPVKAAHYTADKELLDSFYSMKSETEENFKYILFNDHCISNRCKIDAFFERFFADTASHPIGHYQRHVIGDSEVHTTPWSMDTNDGEKKYTTKERRITFRHKVSAPVGPPTARAMKHQTCYIFGNHGFIMETQTTLKDVPNSECFRVEDRIVVEQFDGEAIRITIGVQVQFVKNTIWKKLIERMTRTESDAWFQGYVRMLIDALDGAAVSVDSAPTSDGVDFTVTPKVETPAASVTSEFSECDSIESHGPMSTTARIMSALTIWMNFIAATTAEIKGIYILFLMVCLLVVKLAMDLSFMKHEFAKMQLAYNTEIEGMHEAIASIKSQLEVYQACGLSYGF